MSNTLLKTIGILAVGTLASYGFSTAIERIPEWYKARQLSPNYQTTANIRLLETPEGYGRFFTFSRKDGGGIVSIPLTHSTLEEMTKLSRQLGSQ